MALTPDFTIGNAYKAPHLFVPRFSRQLAFGLIARRETVLQRRSQATASLKGEQVAKAGTRAATERFSVVSDLRSTSATIVRPRNSNRIWTRCLAGKSL